jgi:hypothetical protein
MKACAGSISRKLVICSGKVFWLTFGALSLIADFALPFWWVVAATIPILWLSWWVAYRSDWF